MPLLVPSRDKFPVYTHLKRLGVFILDQSKAERQDIRPLRIGLLNLMPASVREKTEMQFFRLMGNTPLQITPVLVRFDKYLPSAGRDRMEFFYEKFGTVKDRGLDGLIVSGANLERDKDGSLLEFDQIFYHNEWADVLNWARENVVSTIYSCLGSHFALYHFYGIRRELSEKKIFGVYDHIVKRDRYKSLISDMNDVVTAPHSRWGNIPLSAIEKHSDLEVVMSNSDCGWLMVVGRKGREIYLQGHPEYDREDLSGEYFRDKVNGQEIPFNYFPRDDETQTPLCNWKADASVFYRNWVNRVYQKHSFEGFADEGRNSLTDDEVLVS